MAYNYSPMLLRAHKELVEKLIQLADTRGQASQTFDEPDKARWWRLRVSELLANLARNQPSLAYVRATLRTWIKYEGERYVVYVGVPQPEDRIRGAKPGLPVSAVIMGREEQRLVIGEAITAENWPTIGVKLAAAKVARNVRYIELTNPPEQKGIEFIAKQLEPEYTLLQTKPVMVFERAS